MRLSLGLFWLAAGTMHFVRPRFYEEIVPPPLDSRRKEVVAISGIAELLGGVLALAGPPRVARCYLLALLAAVYPANVYMAVRPQNFKRFPAAALWGRLPIQFLFAWHAWKGTQEPA